MAETDAAAKYFAGSTPGQRGGWNSSQPTDPKRLDELKNEAVAGGMAETDAAAKYFAGSTSQQRGGWNSSQPTDPARLDELKNEAVAGGMTIADAGAIFTPGSTATGRAAAMGLLPMSADVLAACKATSIAAGMGQAAADKRYVSGATALSHRRWLESTRRAGKRPGGVFIHVSDEDPKRRGPGKKDIRRILGCPGPGCAQEYPVLPGQSASPIADPIADGWTSWMMSSTIKTKFKAHLRQSPDCVKAVHSRWVGSELDRTGNPVGGSEGLGPDVAMNMKQYLP